MDCETPLGKIFIDHQKQTQKILDSMGYVTVNMATKDAGADVLIGKEIDGELTMVGVAEIKCRKMAGSQILTREYLKRNGGYLITNDKLKFGQSASFLFGVPYFLIVNLLHEGVLLIWKVTDDKGLYLFDFDTKDTLTKMTCNGGEIVRPNSYLPVDKATVFEY